MGEAFAVAFDGLNDAGDVRRVQPQSDDVHVTQA
jgi:hypothetical protein